MSKYPPLVARASWSLPGGGEEPLPHPSEMSDEYKRELNIKINTRAFAALGIDYCPVEMSKAAKES